MDINIQSFENRNSNRIRNDNKMKETKIICIINLYWGFP